MRSVASTGGWWTNFAVARVAKAAIGRLSQKIARQLSSSVSTPPISGPSALPSPATPSTRPPASPARSAGRAAKVIPRIAGHISAPPTPIPIRAAISTSALGAIAPSAEKAAKIAVPMKKISRRPSMSASRPPVTRPMPKTST